MIAYWFSREDGTTEYQEDPACVGRTDTWPGKLVPCESGLHASPTPWDALSYARGSILWVVSIPDDAVTHGNPVDKYASSSRKYLFKIETTKIMRQFAAQCALDVFDKWDPPDVVRNYIEGTIRGEDKSSVRAAARDAAWDAAWDAAGDAAWAAARDAARDAAGDAAWAAARDAAWAAAWAAARDAAWAAAGDAAWDAARDAAWAAARDAARDEQRKNFNRLIEGDLEEAGYLEASDANDKRT